MSAPSATRPALASRCSSPPKTCPFSVTPNQSNPLCRGTSHAATTRQLRCGSIALVLGALPARAEVASAAAKARQGPSGCDFERV